MGAAVLRAKEPREGWGLKRHTRGEDEAVVVGVVGGGGELHSGSEGDAEPSVNFPATYEAGSDEVLNIAVVRAAFVKRGVEFDLREKGTAGVVLQGGVPGDGAAQLV